MCIIRHGSRSTRNTTSCRDAVRDRRVGRVELGQARQSRVLVRVGDEKVDRVAAKLILGVHHAGPVVQRRPKQLVLHLRTPTLNEPRNKKVCSPATRPQQLIKSPHSR